MKLGRTPSFLLLAALLLGSSGCKLWKKKPNIRSQAQAPTIQPATTTTQSPGPPPPITSEPARPLPTPEEITIATATPPKPKPRPARKVVQPPAPPKKTVVENTPAPAQQSGPLTAASISHDEALHQKLDTTQLIEATESNLRGLNRTLSSNEQTEVQHIRSYVKEAQNAMGNGDFERAYNLALKAHLLSDELTKKK
ncbi:MAG TPA: hypothetical protein VN577_00935 [Terriglobales bacterium]|nr:hypothetical protein [Terriglobales bacterium]